MTDTSNTVPDTSGPGILRPKFPPIRDGETFYPLMFPEFDHQISLPPNVKPNDPLALFMLFFSHPMVEYLVANTNENFQRACQDGKVKDEAIEWIPLTANELYLYLGILVYMSFTEMKDPMNYWNTDPEKYCGLHFAISSRMSKHRFEAIRRWFYISPEQSQPGVFQKV